MDGMSLLVTDVQASIAFYTRLGFTTELTDPSGKGFALMRIGGGTIGLQRHKGEDTPKVRDGIHVELSTEDLDGLYVWMQETGIAVEKPPHDRPWERVMVLRDPDGFRVEVSQGKRGHNRPG